MMGTIQISSDSFAYENYQNWIDKTKNIGINFNWNEIEIALNEAFTNALIHGNKFDSTKKIEINYHYLHIINEIHFSIIDEGEGFKLKETPNFLMDKNLINEGGRGILLMKKLSKKFHYSTNPFTAHLTFTCSTS